MPLVTSSAVTPDQTLRVRSGRRTFPHGGPGGFISGVVPGPLSDLGSPGAYGRRRPTFGDVEVISCRWVLSPGWGPGVVQLPWVQPCS